MKLENYQLLGSIREHKYYISSLAITPDNKTLVSGSCDGTVKIWNLTTGELLHNLTDHSSEVWSVAITPNGETLVSGSQDSTVKIWNLQTGELLNTISGYSKYQGVVCAVAISPDGKFIACSRDNCNENDNNRENECIVQIWRLDTLQPVTFLTGDFETKLIKFSDDGQYIAGCFWNCGKIWRVSNWELVNSFDFVSFECGGTLSPDVKIAVQGSYKWGGISLIDTIKGAKISDFMHIEEHEHGEATAFCFTSDAKILVSGGCGILNFWDLQTQELIGSIGSSIIGSQSALTFSSDARTLVCGGWGGEIEVWEVSFNSTTQLDKIPFGDKSSLTADFDPNRARWEELQKRFNLGDDGLSEDDIPY